MKKARLVPLILLAGLFPAFAFAASTSASFIIESDSPVAGGGRQSSDSYTNISSVENALLSVRATSTSYMADFGIAFWNAAHPGTLTVTDTSDVNTAAAFTLSYSSADPDSPLFMVCYGTVQADVESSCSSSSTRAFTTAFSYRFSGLTNNTTYYFRVYPLSGYDSSANPIISPYYSATVSASREYRDIFTPISGSSGSGYSDAAPPAPPVVAISDDSLLPPPVPSVIERVTDFITSVFNPDPSAPAPKNLIANNRLPAPPAMPSSVVSIAPLPATPTSPRAKKASQMASIEGAVFGTKGIRSVPLSGTRITLYECPSPASRPAGCTVWHPAKKGQANPVISDPRGTFSFDAPVGIYYLKVVKTGYEAADSVPFPVAEVARYARIDMKPASLWKKLFGYF